MLESMFNGFRAGGWMMYPVVALGIAGVGAAGRFALRGEHQLLGFIRWLMLTVNAAGGFGFLSGMMLVFNCATAEVCWSSHGSSSPMVLLLGTQEALNNPAAALLFTFITAGLTAVGQRRFPLPNPSAVPR